MFEMLIFDKIEKIRELKREIKVLRRELDLALEDLDYEERRRLLAELRLQLELDKKEVNVNDHI